MEMRFGVGKIPENSGDQECWASGHAKSLIPPKPLLVPTRVCRASRQGWRSTLGMSFWEGAPPAPPAQNPSAGMLTGHQTPAPGSGWQGAAPHLHQEPMAGRRGVQER